MAVLFIISTFHSTKPFSCLYIRMVDDEVPMRVASFSFQIWDLYSDIGMCYTYWYIYSFISEPIYLNFAVLSTIFLIIPYFIHIFYGIVILPKKLNPRAKQWLVKSYDRWFVFVTVTCGNIYSCIQLCSSKLLGVSLFDMNLTQFESKRFQNVGYITILLENIPEVVLNITFLILHNSTLNLTLFSAILSSILAIVTFILASLTRALHGQSTPIVAALIIEIMQPAAPQSQNDTGAAVAVAATKQHRKRTSFRHREVGIIIQKTGYRRRMATKLALALRVPRGDIQVRSIVPTTDGCIIEFIFNVDSNSNGAGVMELPDQVTGNSKANSTASQTDVLRQKSTSNNNGADGNGIDLVGEVDEADEAGIRVGDVAISDEEERIRAFSDGGSKGLKYVLDQLNFSGELGQVIKDAFKLKAAPFVTVHGVCTLDDELGGSGVGGYGSQIQSIGSMTPTQEADIQLT